MSVSFIPLLRWEGGRNGIEQCHPKLVIKLYHRCLDNATCLRVSKGIATGSKSQIAIGRSLLQKRENLRQNLSVNGNDTFHILSVIGNDSTISRYVMLPDAFFMPTIYVASNFRVFSREVRVKNSASFSKCLVSNPDGGWMVWGNFTFILQFIVCTSM